MYPLSGFAERFRSQLRIKYPELASSATPSPQDGGPDYGLRIEVPPATSHTSPMTIEAADQEITVCFDLWEMSYAFGWPYEARTPAEAITEALSVIDGILAEKKAIMLGAADDDHCVIAYTFNVADGPKEDYYRVCVRSWRGTYDIGWCLPWPVWE